MRRAAAGFDLLENRVTADVARDDIFPVLGNSVALRKFFHAVVEEPATELVAKRIPHDRVHADQSGRQMADRKKLDELHVHERRAGAQCQRITVAAHIGRRAVSPVKPA